MIRLLLILHFLGLAMGLAVPLANIVMSGLIAGATPPEKGVLGRFPMRMSRVGYIGLTTLWVTGVSMVFAKYGGFAALPRTFFIKLTAVALLTVTVAYAFTLERRIRKGDMAAVARIEVVGKIAALFALIAVVFAVLTFD